MSENNASASRSSDSNAKLRKEFSNFFELVIKIRLERSNVAGTFLHLFAYLIQQMVRAR